MLGKIIGAAAGAAAGNATSGMTGAKGAIAGTLAVAAARRMGVLGLLAAGAGGYLLKRMKDKKEQKRETLTPVEPVRAPSPQPA